MDENKSFNGFLSYCRHDAETDPGVVEAFATDLERRINAKLLNTRFDIWRDINNIRVGEKWNQQIESALSCADVFIVLVSPRWIESTFCRREYQFFEERVESKIEVGEYVAPILIRSIERQKDFLTAEQLEVYDGLFERQFFKADAVAFMQLSPAERAAKIDLLADDIVGMLQRLRDPSVTAGHSATSARRKRRSEFEGRSESYAEVDFLRSYEVLIDPARGDAARGVYAQVDFVERLYVKGRKALIEFGVGHAHLSLSGDAAADLLKFDGFRVIDPGRAAYVSLREEPKALSIAINAKPGTGLSHLALPPTEGNYWSRIATAPPHLEPSKITAVLSVSFSPYGLYLGEKSPLSQASKRKIEAILAVALEKNERLDPSGRIQRSIPMVERKP
ncbi:hypothetical protein SE92_20900 [Bradyrhizobium sp. AT1]|uniref:toll/interleukin-1 receptor domain-containing protein n=1 Tax=Bradyrhizobium sp. AT1 TaxID=574934 RepID=UPI00079A2507|nr:toll/interleukin-1 receptor domain-containing protein [Bradyrhizobium sp. AT1]KYG22373.1 hypothetical protein SE92_20900 [Bradyrhizobium sp. AT1]